MEGAIHNTEWCKNNRRFHLLARNYGLNKDDVQTIIYSHYEGKVSTTELTADEVKTLCLALQQNFSEQEAELDQWRKRVIGIVCRYCRLMSYKESSEYAISIITRGGKSLNKMSKSELVAKYNAFAKMVRELTACRPTIPLYVGSGVGNA